MLSAFLLWGARARADAVPPGFVVDPRFPYTVGLAPLLSLPLAGTFENAAGQQVLLTSLFGGRLTGFVPVAERTQVGVGLQSLWTQVDGKVFNITTVLAGPRWLQLDDRFRTAADVQVAIDVGSGFGLGVRVAGSAAYELPLKGLFVQGALAGELMAIRFRAAVTLSAGLSYSW